LRVLARLSISPTVGCDDDDRTGMMTNERFSRRHCEAVLTGRTRGWHARKLACGAPEAISFYGLCELQRRSKRTVL